MNTITCCVVDDEPLAAQLIESYINKTPNLSLAGVYSSAQDAFAAIQSGGIDLVFLDIRMPQLSGLEFARLIPPTTRIVFTTAYADYAIDGYKVNAAGYLLKPVSYEQFLGEIERIMRLNPRPAISAAPDNEPIIVKSEYKLRQINKNDILFIEGLKDYVKFYVDNEPRAIVSLLNLKNLEKTLAGSPFMRVHRSYIVNLSKIRLIERGNIIIGEHTIPVSESYRPQLTEYINAHTPAD